MEISAPLVALALVAKEFLQKVITPSLEETGLLIAEQVRYFRFVNEVKIAAKADQYLKSNNIDTHKVSLKVMLPLLEGASMEEEESLQDKWAALLANTVAKGSQISTTTLYSYILSQLTKEDAEIFEIIYNNSTQTAGSNIQMTIKNERAVHKDTFTIKGKEMQTAVSVDNLIRLRLIKEPPTHGIDSPFVILTDLGFTFMPACRFR